MSRAEPALTRIGRQLRKELDVSLKPLDELESVDQLAVFEVQMTVIDHPTDRRRWNGGPMASEDATEALDAAVKAFREAIVDSGFEVVRTGYGVIAQTIAQEH